MQLIRTPVTVVCLEKTDIVYGDPGVQVTASSQAHVIGIADVSFIVPSSILLAIGQKLTVTIDTEMTE
jgi:hypothetical protein